jgi:hypothetical protein
MDPEDALDAALEIVSTLSPEYGGELSDHTPMACEALVRLGHAAAIEPYLARVLPKRRALADEHAPALSTFAVVARQASDDVERLGLGGALEGWLPRLVAGFSGAAFHGAIRVGHALRALGRRPSAPRRAELGRALAYTALRAEPLLTSASIDGPRRSITEALAEITPSPDALSKRETALISTALVERAGRSRSESRLQFSLWTITPSSSRRHSSKRKTRCPPRTSTRRWRSG